jgi:hypothetical protein
MLVVFWALMAQRTLRWPFTAAIGPSRAAAMSGRRRSRAHLRLKIR